MSQSLTIKEENYKFWKTSAIISSILCLITFTVFWNIDNAFWVSILRLGAFIFFAATILSYLQIMNGPIEITINTEKNKLLISYSKKGKTIQEEEFERELINNIYPSSTGINMILAQLKPALKTFKIDFTDTSNDLYLFEYSGRPLLFNKTAQEKVITFFENVTPYQSS